MKDYKFLDRYGNMKPNSWDNQSENPTTFNASYYFSGGKGIDSWELTLSKYRTNNRSWRTMEYDNNKSFSHDEKVSACAILADYDSAFLDNMPLFTTDPTHYRPDVFLYVLGSKYKWLRWFLAPLIKFRSWLSLKDFEKDPIGEASGVQKSFIMLSGWGIEYKLYTKEVMKKAMDIYYPEEDHPTRKLWRDK